MVGWETFEFRLVEECWKRLGTNQVRIHCRVVCHRSDFSECSKAETRLQLSWDELRDERLCNLFGEDKCESLDWNRQPVISQQTAGCCRNLFHHKLLPANPTRNFFRTEVLGANKRKTCLQLRRSKSFRKNVFPAELETWKMHPQIILVETLQSRGCFHSAQ